MKFDLTHIVLILIIVGLVVYSFWPQPDISDILLKKDKLINSLKIENIKYRDLLLLEQEISDSLHNQSVYLDSLLSEKLKDIEDLKDEHNNEINTVLELNTIESIDFFSKWINE